MRTLNDLEISPYINQKESEKLKAILYGSTLLIILILSALFGILD